MSGKLNLKQMFGIETDLPPPSYTPPKDGGVDDVTIIGIPHSFSLKSLVELARLEFSERYEYMPPAIYAPAIIQHNIEAVRVFLKDPIDSDVALEIFSDCADCVMEHLDLPADNTVLWTRKTGLFQSVYDRAMQRRQPPDPSNGPA